MTFNYEEYLLEQQQYLEQNIDIYKYNNPHPDNKDVGDCVKRAITICSNMDYSTVQIELNRYKKITNTQKFSHNKNWTPYVEKVLRWEKISGFLNMKVGEFAKQHPEGTYLISVRKHLTAVVDGVVYDTWNCSFKAINRVWKVK
jgi:hypothetical protein